MAIDLNSLNQKQLDELIQKAEPRRFLVWVNCVGRNRPRGDAEPAQ